MLRKIQSNIVLEIVFGFAGAILLGALLLMLPISVFPDKQLTFLTALFESTSAVCVTGLVVTDTATTFTAFGRTVLLLLIQAGGIGVAILGVTAAKLLKKQLDLRERGLIRNSWNIDSSDGITQMLTRVLRITFICEGIGAILSFPVFLREHDPIDAVFRSVFHSVSAFNNAGFDLSGNYASLTGYRNDIWMNFVTCSIIIVSGIGYLTILDIISGRSPRKYSLNTKIALTMTTVLLVGGTLLLKLTERCTWLEAFFQSVTARTAGFNTIDLGAMSTAGQFIMVLLMICGACPGSTGGGVKTTTVFVLFLFLYSASRNTQPEAFKRRITVETIRKALTVILFSVLVLIISTLLMCVFEPEYSFMALLFEVTSAVNTVGVTTGITYRLGTAARVVLIVSMFLGRLGPVTIATMWANPEQKSYTYSTEQLMIG